MPNAINRGDSQPLLTADTITDEQIRELRHAYTHPSGFVNRDVEHACDCAMSTIPGVRNPARARCAEMLNARAGGAK